MNEPRKSPIDPEAKPDDRVDNALRPEKLNDLIGQDQVKENLSILIDAARKRGEEFIETTKETVKKAATRGKKTEIETPSEG